MIYRVLDLYVFFWLEGVLWVRIESFGGCCLFFVSVFFCFFLYWGFMIFRVIFWIIGDKEGCFVYKRFLEREWCIGVVVIVLVREVVLCVLSRWVGLGFFRI